MEDVILSVLIPTYNHEKFITQAVDGVFSQITNYKYEVLVGDDVSPDNTREVLKQLEAKYSDRNFHVFYREHNLCKSYDELDNHMDLYHKAKGKYVIFLEGDDYWLDKNKIEEQVRFLEEHPGYVAVAHNCLVVDEFGNKREEVYPECKDEEYLLSHYEKGILPGQLATFMMKNIYKLEGFESEMWEKRLVPGDRLFYFSLLAYGKIGCIQKCMTAYRYVNAGGTSYSATVKYDFFYDEYWHRELCGFAVRTRKKEFVRCAETLYLDCIVKGLRYKNIRVSEVPKYLGNLEMPFVVIPKYLLIYIPIYLKKSANRFLGIGYKKL